MSEGYNNIPTHILYPERRIICRQHAIDESAGSYRHRMPAAVENLDPATLEIADKEPRPLRGLHNGNSLVDGLSRMVHLQNGVVEISGRIPTRYRAILRHEDKESLQPWLTLKAIVKLNTFPVGVAGPLCPLGTGIVTTRLCGMPLAS